MGALRKIEVLLSVALLAVFLVGAARNLVSVGVLVLGAFAIGGYLLLRSAWPKVRRVAKTLRPPEGVSLELLPPPERYAARDPVPFTALIRTLEAADLGTIERRETALVRLVTRAGEWLEVSTTSPEATTLGSVRMATSSGDLAAFACDALVSRLGPLTLRIEGVELFIDGTLPLSELERELHDLRMNRMRELTRELHEIEDAKESRAPRSYLN